MVLPQRAEMLPEVPWLSPVAFIPSANLSMMVFRNCNSVSAHGQLPDDFSNK